MHFPSSPASHPLWTIYCGQRSSGTIPLEMALMPFANPSFLSARAPAPSALLTRYSTSAKKNLALDLLSALQSLRASRLLSSSGRGKNLFSDLSRLNFSINSDDFNLDYIKPLLRSAIADEPDNALWK
ncbi:hypothetical protein BN1723_016768, partial [Verticillium longisporum]